MSIPKYVSRAAVFQEFDEGFQNDWFSLKEKKVIADFDNFYYTVVADEDNCEEEIACLIADLNLRRDAFDFKSPNTVDFMGLDYYPFGQKVYNNRLSKPECFDILICEKLPNDKTPRFMIQLRARFLWLYGFTDCFNNSFEILKLILTEYGIEIKKVMENRVDYAFHNNLVQNMASYFSREKLVNSCATNARKYSQVGDPNRDWDIQYFSIGQRGKAVFFRIYDKTREVVEKSFKGFFFDIWRENELISKYDQYCLEVAFERRSYDVGILIGRINWYLEYGNDDVLKTKLKGLLKKCYADNSNSSEIRKQIKGLLPDTTTISNFEFETLKDFYRSFDQSLLSVPLTRNDSWTARVFQIYDCRKAFVDYLTSFGGSVAFMDDLDLIRETIKSERNRFVKTINGKRVLQKKEFEEWKAAFINQHYADFWKRVRACNFGTDYNPDIKRSYERTVDVERVKRRVISDIALLSIHRNGVNECFDINADMSDFFSVLNDNDMNFIGAVSDTGELTEIKYGDYYTVKQRKNRQYRSICPSVQNGNK